MRCLRSNCVGDIEEENRERKSTARIKEENQGRESRKRTGGKGTRRILIIFTKG